MAMLPCKRILILLLLIFVLLCCFSNTAIAARSLGVPQLKLDDTHNHKANGDDLKVHDEEHFSSTDDLGAMDYTPASKKPPIHN